MTLLVLRYQRARPGADGNSPEMLDAHFHWIASHFENVLPGERPTAGRDSVCLAFDGGFYDFHASVFPLLLKHRLRALLAVAPALVRDHTTTARPDRLAVVTADAYAHPTREAFCTWSELEELAASGHVAVAAHGYTHRALDGPDADAEAEVHVPRTLLGARLKTLVESFVFPYGRFNRRVLDEAKSGYDFVFGHGEAENRNWHQQILYRVNANNLTSPQGPFTAARRMRYRARFFFNALCPK